MMKEKYYLSDEDRGGNGFSVIADFEGNEEQLMNIDVDDVVPVLPLRNMVLFPGVFMPVSVGRRSSLKLIREADKKKTYIGVVCQKVAETEDPQFDDLHSLGTVAKIVRVLDMPDHTTTVILQGSKRMELKEIVANEPFLKGRIALLDDKIPDKSDKEFQALVEACKQTYGAGKLAPFAGKGDKGVIPYTHIRRALLSARFTKQKVQCKKADAEHRYVAEASPIVGCFAAAQKPHADDASRHSRRVGNNFFQFHVYCYCRPGQNMPPFPCRQNRRGNLPVIAALPC